MVVFGLFKWGERLFLLKLPRKSKNPKEWVFRSNGILGILVSVFSSNFPIHNLKNNLVSPLLRQSVMDPEEFSLLTNRQRRFFFNCGDRNTSIPSPLEKSETSAMKTSGVYK